MDQADKSVVVRAFEEIAWFARQCLFLVLAILLMISLSILLSVGTFFILLLEWAERLGDKEKNHD